MKQRKNDRQLLSCSTPIYPTDEQEPTLRDLQRQVRALHLGLTTWVQGGAAADLTALLALAGDGNVFPPLTGPVQVRALSEAQWRQEVLAALPRSCTLPEALLMGVISQAYRRFKPILGRQVKSSSVPTPHAELHLPLDAAVTPVGAYHVHLDGLGSLLLADIWRLPLGLSSALHRKGRQVWSEVQGQVDRAHRAAIGGYQAAARDLCHLAERYGPLMDLPAVPAEDPVSPEEPHLAGRATLQSVRRPDGTLGWVIVWMVRVPADWLPGWTRADTVGVDVGVHQVISWVDQTETGGVPGRLSPPSLDKIGQETLARAVERRIEFEALGDQRDATLRHLLSYRSVAIEDTRWTGLAARHPEAVDQMRRSGATEVLPWLSTLAHLTGTRVVRVPPGHTSHRCGRCGSPGQVHRDRRIFTCDLSTCSWTEDADLNAARYMRLWEARS